jgi:hypothetical protein
LPRDKRRALLRQLWSGPAGTAVIMGTGMLAVGSWDPIRHGQSWVCLTIPHLVSMISFLS